jgi:Ca-activated chloride channel family protein
MSPFTSVSAYGCGKRARPLTEPGLYQRRLLPVALVLVSAGVGVTARQAEVPRFQSSVDLVEVYATVTDEHGAAVTDLGRDDFDVYEDGHPQVVTTFAAGAFPLTVALGIDRSWSMAGRPLDLAKQSARSFLDQLTPTDRAMVVAVSANADVIAPLSTDRVEQANAIGALDPWSTTALRDAVIAVVDRLEPEPGRQAVIVLSDGVDRYSRATEGDVLERLRRSHALVYPIVIGASRAPLLAEMAVLTGGRSFVLKDARELQATLASIAQELRHQYLLGYVPAPRSGAAAAPGWRSIRVALRHPRPGMRVRARDGYAG